MVCLPEAIFFPRTNIEKAIELYMWIDSMPDWFQFGGDFLTDVADALRILIALPEFITQSASFHFKIIDMKLCVEFYPLGAGQQQRVWIETLTS